MRHDKIRNDAPHKMFLDLEQTLIESWDKPYLIHIKQVEDLIKSYKNLSNVSFHIFSYAIWDEYDKTIFECEMKQRIEDQYGITISTWLSVQEMQKICGDYLRICMDQGDFFGFMKKEIAFPIICNSQFRDTNCILLDDVVRASKITDDLTRNSIHMINIKPKGEN